MGVRGEFMRMRLATARVETGTDKDRCFQVLWVWSTSVVWL